jgi:RHS repeat-associated protein
MLPIQEIPLGYFLKKRIPNIIGLIHERYSGNNNVMDGRYDIGVLRVPLKKRGSQYFQNLRSATCRSNVFNQYTNRTVPDTFDVMGIANTTASVTVNNTGASLYGDYTFAAQGLTLVDGNNTFTAIGQDSLGRKGTNAVTVWLPASATFQYDANGNLLSDGRRGFAYDDENQLVRVTVTNAWKTEFQYDGKMRLRVRKEYAWLSGAFTQTNEVHYVYDGMLVIQERNASNIPLATYTRGLDLSSSRQGAGGIGGLLARTDNGLWNGSGTDGAHTYYSADGNGNITCLLNSKQIVVGRYVYDPYGNTLSLSGPQAEANPYRFSSKEYMVNSGLYAYGYRFYEPSLQRWLNRDPLGEIGHRNIRGACVSCYKTFVKEGGTFRFCDNVPTLKYDSFGLLTKDDCDEAKDSADKKADASGTQCLFNAAAEGVIGEVVIGGIFTIGGAIIGKVPGAGVGLVVGTGLNLALDMCHLRACKKKVDKMKKDAQDAYDDCLKRVDQ